MLFQTLDNKNGCINFYCDGTFRSTIEEGFDRTWKHNEVLKEKNIDFAQIYVEGKELEEICPEHLKEEWNDLQSKLFSFYTSFQIAKVNLNDVCFYDLVPQKFLLKYCEVKNTICEWIFENCEKPPHYDLMKNILRLISEIQSRELNLNWDKIDTTNITSRALLRKKNFISNKIQYNPWKTKTGRLATTSNSFPILTMSKESRRIIEPQNDLFVELDFNSAELRTALSLLKIKQPIIDIHDWILKNVFDNKISREKSKEKTFAWFYNIKASNKKLEKIFDKNKILEYHYDGQFVKTFYDRKIPVEERKALNYIIQSTTSDLVLTQAMKVKQLMEKSFIAFIIHDSIILDFHRTEQDQLTEIIEVFSNTDLGKFKTNVALGKNFGEMRKV